jgi:hypothetical protein
MQFQFEVRYQKGKEYTVVVALSRYVNLILVEVGTGEEVDCDLVRAKHILQMDPPEMTTEQACRVRQLAKHMFIK